MTTVQQLLAVKGHDVWSIRPDDTVFKAIETMAEKNIGSLVVMDDDKFLGLITERSYARNVILKGRKSRKTKVAEIMATRVFYVRVEDTVETCIAVMAEKNVRHLPVLEGDRVVGLIAIQDLLKSIISGQEFTIQQLENIFTVIRPLGVVHAEAFLANWAQTLYVRPSASVVRRSFSFDPGADGRHLEL